MIDRRVLVTGAGGFIGRASLAPLLARGYEVHAVNSPAGAGRVAGAPAGIARHRADLLDAAATAALFAAVQPTHLLHFAWIATPGVYCTSAANGRWLEAGRVMLDAFRRHGGVRAVMAGSCAEYDWSRAGLCHEATTALATLGAAPTAYASAKIAMHERLDAFGRASGVSTAWGRLFFQYGPHEHAARLVPAVILNLLQEREAPCSHGRQVRSFLHVADVGDAFAAVLDSTLDGAVNIGSADAVAIGELVLKIGALLGRRHLVRLGARAAPAGEPALLLPDIGRLTGEVGWRPRIPLDAGLADTIAWWRGRLAGSTS